MSPLEIVLLLAYSGAEYWLGKTKKLEANSAIELLLNVARDFLTKRK